MPIFGNKELFDRPAEPIQPKAKQAEVKPEDAPESKDVKREKVSAIETTIYPTYKQMIKALMTLPFDLSEVDPVTNRNREEDRKMGIAAFGEHLLRKLVEKVEHGDTKIVTEVSAEQLRARFNEIFPPEPPKSAKEKAQGAFAKFKSKLS